MSKYPDTLFKSRRLEVFVLISIYINYCLSKYCNSIFFSFIERILTKRLTQKQNPVNSYFSIYREYLIRLYIDNPISILMNHNQIIQKGDHMKDYNFEYQYKNYNQKQRKYRIPIEMKLDNENYNQKQLEFLRKLFPNGINKQNKIDKDFLLEIFPNGLKKFVEVN